MVIKPVSTATVTEGIDQQFTVKRHLSFFTLNLRFRVIKAATATYIGQFAISTPYHADFCLLKMIIRTVGLAIAT